MRKVEQDAGRLIILGGGIAGLTAAFYASEPGHEQVFPGGIHVYEMTARLGGKGASVRNTTSDVVNRIEEHGLHVWFGFYDNAFALLKLCHDYLEGQAKSNSYHRHASSLRGVEDGFRPCSRVAVVDYDGSSWQPWVADFPEDGSARPWDPRDTDATGWSPSILAVRALRLAETFLYSLTGSALAGARAHTTFIDPALVPIPFQLPTLTWLSDALNRYLAVSLTATGGTEVLSQALRVVSRAASEVRSRLDETVRRHSALRRTWYLVDLLLAAVRGLIDDGVVATGNFELIDDIDLRAWLVLHGASEESVSSGLLKALVYDLAFAYEDGDPAKPACSAATGVYGLLRLLLTYRGAIMWKMNAGMGEIVFAPIYEALRKRGVHCHFGHEVATIALRAIGGARKEVTKITFKERDDVASDVKLPTLKLDKEPLPGRLPYWPSVPRAQALQTPAALELRRHDMVVYGLPVATIKRLLPNAPPPWTECARKVKTVATAALQLWLNAGIEQYAPLASPDLTVGAFTEPFDTWSDMKTLAGEASAKPWVTLRSVAYFTNAAPDALRMPFLKTFITETFIAKRLTDLWPQFDPSMVLDRFVRLNRDASSRYSLSLPGTLKARLSPHDDSIRNMRPVGDWTRNSINAGCIEAAVISGMLAARVLRPDCSLTIFGEGT